MAQPPPYQKLENQEGFSDSYPGYNDVPPAYSETPLATLPPTKEPLPYSPSPPPGGYPAPQVSAPPYPMMVHQAPPPPPQQMVFQQAPPPRPVVIQQAPPPQHVVIQQAPPTSVVIGTAILPPGVCTVCRAGKIESSSTLCTWFWCLLLLPVFVLPGIIAFFYCCRKPKCTNCGYTV